MDHFRTGTITSVFGMDGHGNNKAKDTHAKGVCMGKLSSHQALVKDGATIAMSQTDICYTYDA